MKKFDKQLYKRVTDVKEDGRTVSIITQKYRMFNPYRMETTIFCETKIMEYGLNNSNGWVTIKHSYHPKDYIVSELAFLHDSYVRMVRKMFNEGVELD